MKPEYLGIISSLAGVTVGGLISYLIQLSRQRHAYELKIEELKTEHMAERTARYYLSHKGYTDRRFDTLQKALGGFEDDELRKILVRAGAVRSYRDNEEWWTLLERLPEKIEKKQKKRS
ncbi:hypothetical protein FNH22_12075 [Fulvivirga sp. M361]|uniref:hypothetical protein n=1 Tax=Fulvivirga sp. M361 TaxID=2594266 RepID=UPI00117B9E19|nr:hypothetical protein [Fulvivirga sp. M361]TRX58612.1 hypothetical protein FNH22_12075 [Fulvivirga sp. M361]